MKIDRLLFLAASATMAGACGGNAVKASLFDDQFAATAKEGPSDSPEPCGEDGGVAPGLDTGTTLDTGASPPPDADATANGEADAAAEASVVPTGDPNEICAPFTCELGEWSCRAAMGGGVSPKVSAALYACAESDCVQGKTWSELEDIGVDCAATALAADAAGPRMNALCAGLTSCLPDAGGLSLARCETLYSGLTYSGAITLADRELTCGGDTEKDFVRQTLYFLSNP